MTDSFHYVPILKSKKAEFQSIGSLVPVLKSGVTPLIDIVPDSKEKLQKHINKIIGYFKLWGTAQPIIIDGYMFAECTETINGLHPIVYLLRELNGAGYRCIPVINAGAAVKFNNLIVLEAENLELEMGLRINRSGFDTAQLNQVINATLNHLAPENIDLIFDLRSLIDTNLNDLAHYCLRALEDIILRFDWRSVILSGGSFPADLVAFSPDQVHIIRRQNWLLWNELIRRGVSRIPTYSDYAITHPVFTEFDSPGMNASASIRYTYEDSYYIYRGRGTRQHGFRQFFDIAEALVNSPQYYGIDHCEGDKFIHKCATQKRKPGNLTSWRWVGILHHIMVVLNQLAEAKRSLSAERT